jgi:hypothetical protein
LHFVRKLFIAAPTSGLPSFPTALLAQLSCAAAGPTDNAVSRIASITRFMSSSFGGFFGASAAHQPFSCLLHSL